MKAFAFLVGFIVSIVPAVLPEALGGKRDVAADDGGVAGGEVVRPGGEIVVAPVLAPEPTPANATAPEAEPEPEPEAAPPPRERRPFTPPKPVTAPEPFTARLDPAESEVLAGNGVELTLVIVNHERWPITVAIEKRDVTAGWHATIAEERVDVEPGESREVPAVLEAPFDAEAGAVGTLTLAVATPLPPTVKLVAASARVPVPAAHREVSIVNGDGSRYVAPGGTANYSFTVQNVGNVRDEFRFEVSSGAPGWLASLGTSSVVLLPSEARSITLAVTAPGDAADGASSWFNVTARSAKDAQAAARAASLTVVDAARQGVPILDVVCLSTPPAAGSAPGGAPSRFCVDARSLLPVLPPAPTLPEGEPEGT